MSYTAPTITASSGTFAQLKLGGLSYQLDLIIATNAGLTQAQKDLIHAFTKPDMVKVYQKAATTVDNFLRGDPIATATVATQILDLATAVTVLKTALDEIGTLVDANAGTLGYTTNAAGMPTPVRTF